VVGQALRAGSRRRATTGLRAPPERDELRLLALGRGLVIGVTAAIIAVVVAILMSPPSSARPVADLHHGIDVDPLLLAGRAAVVVGIVALRCGVAGQRHPVGDHVGRSSLGRELTARARTTVPERRHQCAPPDPPG
jgi:hypothetical protein